LYTLSQVGGTQEKSVDSRIYSGERRKAVRLEDNSPSAREGEGAYALNSDPELAGLYYKCDERAFTVLKIRHQDRQRRRAASTWLSQYRDRTDEVVETSWTKFGLTKVQGSRYDTSRPFTPYIDRILYYECMNFHRELDPGLPLPAEDDPVEDPCPSPERQAELAELVQQLEECARGLNPEERTVYESILVTENKYKETAQSIGLPMGTLATMVQRIRRKLIDCLRQKRQSKNTLD
jgi:RNA polymerase sigma factor (sigma-70 family)